MIKPFVKTVIISLLFLTTLALYSQEQVITTHSEPESVMVISTDEAGHEIIRLFERTQSRWFQDPQAPRFLLTDKKGKFALGIGGLVRAVAEVDFGGIAENIDFLPTQISNYKGDNFAKEQFQMNVTSSTLFLKMVGNTDLIGDFVVYTAADFKGPDKTFRLRNAYASFLGFTVGYDFGSFMDLAVLPPTIDGAGPSGSANYRATQIRYIYTKLPKWQFTAGIEMPEVTGSTNEYLTINTQHYPDIPLAAQYSWNPTSHVRVAGTLRNLSYSSAAKQKNYAETGWGAQASTTFTIGKFWHVFGQFNYGKGIAYYLEDMAYLNLDLALMPKDPERMQLLPLMGWYAGLRFNVTSQVFLSTSYSISRMYSRDGYEEDNPNEFRMGKYYVINSFYDMNSNIRMGMEYLRGSRNDFSRATHHANRINMMVQYSF